MCAFAFVWAPTGDPVDPTVSIALASHLPSSTEEFERGGRSNFVYVAKNQTFFGDNFLLIHDARLGRRSDLARKLGVPENSSVTSLLTESWLKWGEACTDHLYGDFSFLIFSLREASLFVARDALGARPLFYHSGRDGFIGVSTSAKALTCLQQVSDELDERALWMWLQNGYDDRLSMYRDVAGLDWGHQLSADRHGVKIHRYWQPEKLPPIHYINERDYVAHYQDVLDTCVRDRLPAKGPVVSMLSGGMDSTSVTASAVLELGRELVKPLSFRFPTMPECDESELSAAVASGLSVEPGWIDHEPHWYLKGVLCDGVRRENPFVCWESLESVLMRKVRSFGANVLLTGHGGDNMATGIDGRHVLGGDLYRGDYAALGPLRDEHGVRLQRALWRYVVAPRMPGQLARRLRPPTLVQPPEWVPHKAHHKWFEAAAYLKRDRRYFSEPDRQSTFNLVAVGGDGVRRVCHYYYRMQGAFGVDVRHPFFDRGLAELVLRFPSKVMRAGGMPKGLLRKAGRGRLPESVLAKVVKTSLLSFYYKGVQREQNHIKYLMERSVLADMGYVDKHALLKCLERYLTSEPGTVYASFGPLLMLENWLQCEGIGDKVSG